MIFHQIASLSCLPGRQEAVGFFFSFFFLLVVSATGQPGHSRGVSLSSPIRSRTKRGGASPSASAPSLATSCGQFSQGHGGAWSRFLTSRTEGHVSDIDLTCSRLIVAHLPEDKRLAKARCPTLPEFSAHSSSTSSPEWRDSVVGSITSGSLF